MIIYDLPHPILSAIPRPHLLQLQAATVREETHRNAKYCSAGAHAPSAHRSFPPAFPSACAVSGLGDGNWHKKNKKKARKSNLHQKFFVLALTYTEMCLVGKL